MSVEVSVIKAMCLVKRVRHCQSGQGNDCLNQESLHDVLGHKGWCLECFEMYGDLRSRIRERMKFVALGRERLRRKD